eukprot:GILK01004456.1.p1 GENE.GILK01004456.1~~GILK01004456.1.p1  ORF type:complete len:1311 (-),score=247.57 GILK01004456.1:184-4116(-)
MSFKSAPGARYRLLLSHSSFLVEKDRTSFAQDEDRRCLVIDRSTGRMVDKVAERERETVFDSMSIYAFLGIVNILGEHFIFVVTDCVCEGQIEGHNIMLVTRSELIPFDDTAAVVMEAKNGERPSDKYRANLQKLVNTGGFYFSYSFDLTNTLQRKYARSADMFSFHDGHAKGTTSLASVVDNRFFWNRNLYFELKESNVDDRWCVPLVQGFVEVESCYVDGRKVELALISRRSCLRAGTRYNARGIDDEGQVGNFVETEQLVFVKGVWFSHVQIRGSVPVFWEQRGISAQTSITREPDLTLPAFCAHIEEMKQRYGELVMVNLLGNKPHETMLTAAFERQYQMLKPANVGYEYFDFNTHCKGQRFDNLGSLMSKIEKKINSCGFFSIDMQHIENGPLSQQTGSFRVNCLDCLDRTNVLQSKIGLRVLQTQLEMEGISVTAYLASSDPIGTVASESAGRATLDAVFKHMWADCGDQLSKQYTGTGSTISNLTRHGKQGMFGIVEHGLKSLNRFYMSNFEDQLRQECIEILLGLHRSSKTSQNFGIRCHIDQKLKAREDEFSIKQRLSVWVGTWNVAGKAPGEEDIAPWFWGKQNGMKPTAADVIAVGLQEFVELNVSAVLNTDTNRVASWESILLGTLNRDSSSVRYVKLRTVTLVGLYLTVFVKEHLASNIKQVNVDKVKTGWQGTVGNKGAVVIRLMLFDTSVCFVNVHLAAGQDKGEERNAQTWDIFRSGFQQDEVGRTRSTYHIQDHDTIFFFGDMNYRISLSKEETRRLAEMQRITELLKNDQLKIYKAAGSILEGFAEGSVDFLPTYKYDFYSATYDSGKKKRAPAWCDRILWKGANVVQQYYNRVELMSSDHRPVCAQFDVEVKVIQHDKREAIKRAVFENIEDGWGDGSIQPSDLVDAMALVDLTNESGSGSTKVITTDLLGSHPTDDFSFNPRGMAIPGSSKSANRMTDEGLSTSLGSNSSYEVVDGFTLINFNDNNNHNHTANGNANGSGNGFSTSKPQPVNRQQSPNGPSNVSVTKSSAASMAVPVVQSNSRSPVPARPLVETTDSLLQFDSSPSPHVPMASPDASTGWADFSNMTASSSSSFSSPPSTAYTTQQQPALSPVPRVSTTPPPMLNGTLTPTLQPTPLVPAVPAAAAKPVSTSTSPSFPPTFQNVPRPHAVMPFSSTPATSSHPPGPMSAGWTVQPPAFMSHPALPHGHPHAGHAFRPPVGMHHQLPHMTAPRPGGFAAFPPSVGASTPPPFAGTQGGNLLQPQQGQMHPQSARTSIASVDSLQQSLSSLYNQKVATGAAKDFAQDPFKKL